MINFFKSLFGVQKDTESHYWEREDTASQLFRPLAYNEQDGIFLLEGKALGVAFLCHPLCGTSEGLQERIKGLFHLDYPVGSILQFCLFRSPDIARELHQYDVVRPTDVSDKDLRSLVQERIRFMRTHTRKPMVSHRADGAVFENGIVFDVKLMISLTYPIAGDIPEESELAALKEFTIGLKSALSTVELYPHPVGPNEYLRFMAPMINWNEKASWTNNVFGMWERWAPICVQVLDGDTDIQVSSTHLNLGDFACVRACSAKHLPEAYYFGDAIGYAGNVDGQGMSHHFPYAVCCACYFPDKEKLKAEITRKRQFTVNQVYGPIAKFVPELMDKKKSFDILDESLRAGARAMKMSLTVLVWGETEQKCDANTREICDAWREKGFSLMHDKYIQLPLFAHSLPLNAYESMVRPLFKFKTMTSEQAAVLIPIFGEWKGTGTPHLLMSSRNGQLMSFSLHDTGSNKNCVIAAQSGSGKSFFINELVVSYLSEGAQVWVIDAGKSYKKLCEDFKGDFLQFDDQTDIQMNPFELIENYDEEEDTLIALLLNMASMKGNLADVQISELRRIMKELWDKLRQNLTIDDLVEALKQVNDQRLKDIGTQLFPFTKKSSWGKYFARGNNVSFKNRFTVLELDELQNKKHLRQVVLLQLIMQIQHEVYLGDRSRKKIVIIDEAWDLLKEGEVANFMEGAYRKFRKYNGSVIIATQSINDLYQNPVGRAIAENSATMCLLGQKEEAIESVRKDGKLQLGEGMFRLLKTVHTVRGVYSEIFVKAEHGIGIYRLFVDDYSKLLYSTDPTDLNALKRFTDQGMSTSEAIREVLKSRNPRI